MLKRLLRRPEPTPPEDRHVETILRRVAAGGARFERVVFTRNRQVMASIADGGRTLRLHERFRDAPAEIHNDLGRVFSARSPRARAPARERIRQYLSSLAPVPIAELRRRSPGRTPLGDRQYVERLRREFQAVNAVHFASSLPDVPIRLSGRMRRRNGHFSSDPLEIAIARSLCVVAAEGEAERTLRHEMIHLWQWQTGRKVGHGVDFRRWARILDIHPRATRSVCWVVTDSQPRQMYGG